jgi:hypothetical protein
MKEYDEISNEFALYTMFTNTKNFSGNYINTDNYGFRLSKFNDKYISVSSEMNSKEKINIIIGGSTVFGVGATNDDQTIASHLSKITKEKWINLGLRAGNSFQEYINLIKIIGKIDDIGKIVVLGGINDIYMNLVFDQGGINNLDDLIFDNSKINHFWSKYKLSQYSIRRKLTASIISYIKNVEFNSIIDKKSLREMLNFKENRLKNIDLIKTYSLQKLFSIFERNFLLYSSLEKGLENTQIIYFLQPHFNWIRKESNKKEKEIMDYLDINSDLSNMDKINYELYQKIIKKLNSFSLKFNFEYFDFNSEDFGGKDDFTFVDRVHLSDYGNNIASKIIEKRLNKNR